MSEKDEKIEKLLKQAAAILKMSPESIKEAAANGKTDFLISKMKPEDQEKVKSMLKNKGDLAKAKEILEKKYK
ncbi:hypothetical protein FACS1894120_1330 [Clostridia bacterium]|nr:hypothetical protein FACS1894120_1330 [Clostridia bacterium]